MPTSSAPLRETVLPQEDLVVFPGQDGVRLHLIRYGPHGRIPWLLLHGLPADAEGSWTHVAYDLGHAGPVLAPDLPGTGGSEWPLHARQLALDTQAAALLALLDRLQLPLVDVAGHDLGGSVAVLLAALAPERVRSLALLASPLHPDVGVPRGRGSSPPAHSPARRRPFERRRWLRQVDLAPVAAAVRTLAVAPPPVLVLWGTHDTVLSPAYGRRIATDLPGATFVGIDGAGHDLTMTHPERIAEELSGFAMELHPAE